MNNEKGIKLINAIKSGEIKEEKLHDHGKRFYDGYDRLYFDKFCSYLGNVSRYNINLKLEEKPY